MIAVRRQASRVRRRLLGIAHVDAEPYATHLPVLAAVAKVVEVHHVLELGSGTFSTGLFLDRRVFPDLELLESYEDDPAWAGRVRQRAGPDERIQLQVVGAVTESVPSDLARFDLIFIDDSRTSPERAHTIAKVVAARPRGLVMIHDFETRSYRREARRFNHRIVSSAFTPQVGLAWNGSGYERKALQGALSAVARGAHIPVTDVDRWIEHLGLYRTSG